MPWWQQQSKHWDWQLWVDWWWLHNFYLLLSGHLWCYLVAAAKLLATLDLSLWFWRSYHWTASSGLTWHWLQNVWLVYRVWPVMVYLVWWCRESVVGWRSSGTSHPHWSSGSGQHPWIRPGSEGKLKLACQFWVGLAVASQLLLGPLGLAMYLVRFWLPCQQWHNFCMVWPTTLGSDLVAGAELSLGCWLIFPISCR